MKEINLEEILESQNLAIGIHWLKGAINMGKNATDDYQKIINAMREACKQVLELAAKNAKIKGFISYSGDEESYIEVDKQSILDTINQIK